MPRDCIIREATLDDAKDVALAMREADILEVRALGWDPVDALMASVPGAQVAEVKDGPICMFGVESLTPFSTTGVPWMLGTDLIVKHRGIFLWNSRQWMKEQMLRFRYLTNHVDARHHSAIDWLVWLGFTIEQPEPHGINGEPFSRFWWRA